MSKLTKVSVVEVRVNGEWGTFFVRESEVTPRKESGFNAAAEFTANTSFGVYGNYWSSMGCPFGEFISKIGRDYLLSKIATMVVSDKHVVSSARAMVRDYRKRKEIDSETAREAMETIDALAADHTGDVLMHEIYQAAELSFICDWHGTTMAYDGQAIGFVDQLWPEFVKQFNLQSACVGSSP